MCGLPASMKSSSLSSSSGRRHRQGAGGVHRPLGHAGEHPARAELDVVGDAGVGQGQEAVLPAHRARQLGGEQAGPLLAPVVGERIDVGDDRHLGVTWIGLGDGLAQPVASGSHEGRVEGTGDGQRHHPLRAQLLGDGTGGGDALGRTGDHHLARSVEVGHPDVVVGPPAGDLDVLVVQPEHRGHGAGVVDAGLVHRLGPLADQAHAVVEGRARRWPPGLCTRPGCGRRRSCGSMPRRSTASTTIRLVTNVHSWAWRVSFSSSASASSSRRATSRSAWIEASSTSSQLSWSAHGRPMPGRWEPWPGKVKASMVALRLDARSATLLLPRGSSQTCRSRPLGP